MKNERLCTLRTDLYFLQSTFNALQCICARSHVQDFWLFIIHRSAPVVIETLKFGHWWIIVEAICVLLNIILTAVGKMGYIKLSSAEVSLDAFSSYSCLFQKHSLVHSRTAEIHYKELMALVGPKHNHWNTKGAVIIWECNIIKGQL